MNRVPPEFIEYRDNMTEAEKKAAKTLMQIYDAVQGDEVVFKIVLGVTIPGISVEKIKWGWMFASLYAASMAEQN